MPINRAVAISLAAGLLAAFSLAAPSIRAQQAEDVAADPERGKIVYRSVGSCVNCHGWPGDGKSGLLLQAPPGPSLRASTLDTEALTEIIACGIPGTAMPFHDRSAYRDDRCFGMALEDFAPGTAPVRGKTFSEADVANVVAYLEERVIGLGEPTLEECAAFFDNPSAAACRGLE